MRVDHVLNVARRMTDRPTAVCRSWECIGEPTRAIRVELADDSETWPNRQSVDVLTTTLAAEPARYEAETGQCGECGGDGQEWRGWSRDGGHRWRECRRCAGTGNARGAKGGAE